MVFQYGSPDDGMAAGSAAPVGDHGITTGASVRTWLRLRACATPVRFN
jgi:hypothetical protein